MTKQELRASIRTLKKFHTESQLMGKSASITDKISGMSRFAQSKVVLMYHPLPDEVDVRALIDSAFNSGKKVILPVVTGDDLELRVYSPGNMEMGSFGIMEPCGPLFDDYAAIDLAIIPGMAFDSHGHRLGRGKGYYDRLLPKLENAWKMGVCFDFQRLKSLPSEPHDVSMDEVVR